MRVVHRHQSEQMNLELSVSDDKLKLFAKIVPQPNHGQVSDSAITEELLKISVDNLIEHDVVRDIAEQLRAGKGCEGVDRYHLRRSIPQTKRIAVFRVIERTLNHLYRLAQRTFFSRMGTKKPFFGHHSYGRPGCCAFTTIRGGRIRLL